MPVASLAVAIAHLVSAQPSLAPEVPQMTRPVVHIRAVHRARITSLPFVEHLLPATVIEAVGSGFVVDAEGLILTNQHVVHDADLIQVRIGDESLSAEVVGGDRDLDVALLRVHAGRPLPCARLGHSAGVRVGDSVVAVGNPFGLDHTVTGGIVSARLRVIEDGARVPLLQTDASINPGNSGGPLYDLHGRVIGINTAIVAGANGIGFAVPIDLVRQALPQLVRTGHLERGSIGARLGQVTPGAATQLGLPHVRGVLVSAVVPDGPASRAGLRAGDVIVRWDGQAVEASESLPWTIALSPPGTRVPVRVLRQGAPIELNVLIGRPDRDR
jgi:serine protease Do